MTHHMAGLTFLHSSVRRENPRASCAVVVHAVARIASGGGTSIRRESPFFCEETITDWDGLVPASLCPRH